MRSDRFWFGTGLVLAPIFLTLLSLTPQIELTHSGPLEGRVSIHGRPMTGGFILFVPDDSTIHPIVGMLDQQGHYKIRPSLSQRKASDTRFRICLIPKPGQASEADQGEGDHEAATVAHVDAGFPMRLSDPRTSHLEVRLDTRRARVDIAL